VTDETLTARVEAVRTLLARPARDGEAGPDALELLVERFGLDDFERDVLLAAVAADLDDSAGPVTFARALTASPAGSWSALRPDRPLRDARLLVLGDGQPAHAPLAVDERVLHHLRGQGALDERLRPYLSPVAAPAAPLPDSRRKAAARLASLWKAAGATRWGDAAIVVLVHGPGPRDLRDVVALATEDAGRPLWAIDARDVPAAPGERDALARLWNREAVLADAVLLLELGADAAPDTAAAADGLVARLSGPVTVSHRVPVAIPTLAASLPVGRPTREEQRALWERVLPGRGTRVAALARRLSQRYDLDHTDIVEGPRDLSIAADDLEALAAARSNLRIRSRLEGLAERIEPRATWDDLVLPPSQLRLLRHLAATATGRAYLEDAGFGHETARGLGVTALFSGPSGTGKTLAAEILAAELGLDLHRIDLASVVSKWIGETEKHLRRLFDAAEQGGTVLLFDEADALFGKRSEVRDSHDRYANLEVAYLLQRMEQYRGVAILTTNLRSAVDPAVLRRLRVVVQFTHPSAPERARLWERAFPAGVAVNGVDREQLVRLDLTGGEIRTVAFQAALAAAGERAPVGMAHIREAVAAEYGKRERPLTDLEAWE
jgi:hypothetical protein